MFEFDPENMLTPYDLVMCGVQLMREHGTLPVQLPVIFERRKKHWQSQWHPASAPTF